MYLLLLLVSIVLFHHVDSVPVSGVQQLRARFDQDNGTISVQWAFVQSRDISIDTQFVVRYRIANRQPIADDDSDAIIRWDYVRTVETEVRLPLVDLDDGDEIEVQIRAERDGHTIGEWSQKLIITVRKRQMSDNTIDDDADEDDSLQPPIEFSAHVLSPTSVRLEWRVNDRSGVQSGLYYIVNVKQTSSESGGPLLRQQIKIEANNFALGSLIPGEKYEMTIRSALSPQRISRTAAIVEITMPREDEFFEVGNLIISSHFNNVGQGTVNLTWDVPTRMTDKIQSYDVQYSTSGSNEWHRLQFQGNRPTATLRNLSSNTEYLLKIRTVLTSGIITESGQFKFRTPVANPISKVDVVYAHESSAIKLQWMLEPHISIDTIAGYDIYLSTQKDAPEQHWRHIRLDSREASLSLNNLDSGTTYYVRINVRNEDGTILKASSVYRFRTMDQAHSPIEVQQPNTLSYRNIGQGRVSISWSYPQAISSQVTGATILYSEDKNRPVGQWHRLSVTDPTQSSITIVNLRPSTRYFVQVLPKLASGRYDQTAVEMFELKTDDRTEESSGEDSRPSPPPDESAMPEHLQLTACRSTDDDDDRCTDGERCITMHGRRGWCVPDALREAIQQSIP